MRNDRTDPFDERRKWIIFSAVFLAVSVIAFYIPLLQNNFVNWDDTEVIVQNPHIRSLGLDSLGWMLTTFLNSHWMPLTWLTFALNAETSGVHPVAFHLTNLFFHVLNTLLVFFVAIRLLKLSDFNSPKVEKIGRDSFAVSTAFLTALLFGLHPLRVESVVWATERKDVLYSFFYLSAVYVYLGRDFTQGVKSKKLWLCWTLFLLSIMSKLMAMTLPVVFLLLDIWPLHRFGNFKRTVWVEKVPFFVLSIFAGGMALLGTESRTFSMAGNVTLFQRIVNPFHSLAFYIWKMAFPFNLSPLYPFDRALDGAFYAKAALAVIFVAGVSIYCFAKRATQPAWGIGWLFYIVTLLPVLGILQVGGQAAADRYTYLPCLGIFAPVSAAIVLLLSDRKKILSVGALLALLLGFATVLQIGYWKDSETLWGRVTTLYPDQSAFAHTSLAFAYQEEGRTEDALGEYKRAITIPPPLPITYNGMGALLSQMGRNDEAIQTLKNANVIDPKYISAHLNLWTVYVTLGRNQEALTEVLEAIRLDPEVADFYCRLGLNYKALGRIQEARAAFEKAGAMDSANPQYQGEIMKLLTEKTPN